ncbi:unnamed protein product [Allacma fusca]|uniref:DUF1279 domain-containing protein n=1 Tax=Allacma fusca TaxID=39272 RepID=A0A8J2JAD9_9HEXA|nr:unnamed protein product [Allacma fusca]
MAVFRSCQLKLLLRLNTSKTGLKCAQLETLVNKKNLLTFSDLAGPSSPYKCLSTSAASLLCNRQKLPNSPHQLCYSSDRNQKLSRSLLMNGNNYYNSMTSIPDGSYCSKRTVTTSGSSSPSTSPKNDDDVKDESSPIKEGAPAAKLSICYALVSCGLDVPALLERIGVSQAIMGSKITQGASTFVVAYAFHKVFAPARIAITLTATPFIVGYLRRIGFLKKPPT